MSLARIKTWIPGEVLTASDLNSEFSNPLDNALSMISPLTANLAAGGFKITGLGASTTAGDAVRFEDVAVATQAEQETGTSIVNRVTSGRQHFHASAAKAWALAAFAGTVTSSYNCTSVTDGGTGIQTYNWTTALTTGSNSCLVSAYRAAGTNYNSIVTSSASGSLAINTYDTANVAADADFTSVVIFGDL